MVNYEEFDHVSSRNDLIDFYQISKLIFFKFIEWIFETMIEGKWFNYIIMILV